MSDLYSGEHEHGPSWVAAGVYDVVLDAIKVIQFTDEKPSKTGWKGTIVNFELVIKYGDAQGFKFWFGGTFSGEEFRQRRAIQQTFREHLETVEEAERRNRNQYANIIMLMRLASKGKWTGVKTGEVINDEYLTNFFNTYQNTIFRVPVKVNKKDENVLDIVLGKDMVAKLVAAVSPTESVTNDSMSLQQNNEPNQQVNASTQQSNGSTKEIF